MSTIVHVMRHGATDSNGSGRYVGRSDVSLNEEGRRQAAAAARWARKAGVRAIAASPLARTRETAEIVGAPLGLEPVLDERLIELDFGVAEGRTRDELDPAMLAAFNMDPVACPFQGGEDPEEAAARVEAAIRERCTADGEPLLVVAHNTALRLFLCRALGVALRDYRRRFPLVEHCSVTELRWDERDGFALLRLNAPAG